MYRQLCGKLIEVILDVLDSCPGWEPILERITEAANISLRPAAVTFHQADAVLEYTKFKQLFSSTNLVTLMFTLNELVTSQGKVAATKFLIEIVKMIPTGSLILVFTWQTTLNIDRGFPYIFSC